MYSCHYILHISFVGLLIGICLYYKLNRLILYNIHLNNYFVYLFLFSQGDYDCLCLRHRVSSGRGR